LCWLTNEVFFRFPQNITMRSARQAENVRIEYDADAAWQKSGIKIQICADGGRIRERRKKRG